MVYIDPETSNSAAIFVSAKTAQLEGGEIRQDNGSAVRSGVLRIKWKASKCGPSSADVYALAWLRVDVSGLRNIRQIAAKARGIGDKADCSGRGSYP